MPLTRDELEVLREGWDFEAKLASGRDGRGAVPDDLWPTYSAMANTSGGVVVLGVKERADGSFDVRGIADVDRVEKHLWDQLNDRHKVSANLLSRESVRREEIDGRTLLVLTIPQAPRTLRPVHVGRDAFSGTYVRLHEGDRLADRDRVRRMLADADPEMDARVLENYGLDDLEPRSIEIFRNLLSARRPDHAFLAEAGVEFLRQIRAWARDRETGREGPTLAGLLVLGRENAIRDRLHHFHLDYREMPEGDTTQRWLDRVTPDGTWNANLLNFYRLVIPKLHERLPVPFRLAPDLQRRDETHVHEALREALVNALIHADYRAGSGVRVFRYPDRFVFVNPGVLLLPREQVRAGGASECRNKTVQHMLGLIGLGERAGSGFPLIVRAWREQHWRQPRLTEDVQREETTLRLDLHSLLPPEVLEALRRRFGEQFDQLDESGRTVLATASIEQAVDHARLLETTGLRPRDLTLLLQRLLRRGVLRRIGSGRGCAYSLPDDGGEPANAPHEEGSSVLSGGNSEQTGRNSVPEQGRNSEQAGRNSVPKQGRNSEQAGPNSEQAGPNSEQAGPNSEQAGPNSEPEGAVSRLEDGESASAASQASQAIPHWWMLPTVRAVRDAVRTPMERVERAILDACRGRELTLHELGDALGRKPDSLRIRYVRPLVEAGRLVPRFPRAPNHPQQAYRTAPETDDTSS